MPRNTSWPHWSRRFTAYALLLLIPSSAAAQIQRMAIPAGTFRLQPKSTSKVPAYCLDQTRKAPASSTTLNPLSVVDSAHVEVGGQRLTLREAIAKHVVAVRGNTLTFADLLRAFDEDRLTPELRAVKEQWAQFSPEQKAAMEDLVRPELAGLRDHSSLRLENLSDQELRVVFDEPTVLGAQREPAPQIPIELKGGQHDVDIQHKLWEARNNEVLGMLPAGEEGDGKTSLQESIIAFQKNNDLTANGVVGPSTEQALRVAGLNRRSSGVGVIAVEFAKSGKSGTYVVRDGRGWSYRSNEMPQIAAQILARIGHSRRAIYLDTVGFTSRKSNEFVASLRLQETVRDAGVTVRAIEFIADARLNNLAFSGKVKAKLGSSNVPDGVFATRSQGKTVFQAEIPLEVDGTNVFLRVIGKTQELVELFLLKLRELLAGNSQLSIAEITEQVLRDLKVMKPGLSDSDLKARLRSEFGQLQIVWIRRDRAPYNGRDRG